VRNLSQFNAALAKAVGPLSFCLLATFNFWQLIDLYQDFIYVFSLAFGFIGCAYLILVFLDKELGNQ